MFKNWFKPKWQHSNPEVRLIAIEQLTSDKDEHQSVFLQVFLQDLSEPVRISAAKKISDLQKLMVFFRQEKNSVVKDVLLVRMVDLLIANAEKVPESFCQEILSQVESISLLEKILSHTKNPALQTMAVEKIIDENLLVAQALQGGFAGVRKAAAERLTGESALKKVKEGSKSKDKVVYRIVKEKLDCIQQKDTSVKEKNQQCEMICLSLEKLAHSVPTPFFKNQFQVILNQWLATAEQYQAPWLKRFLSAEEICNHRLFDMDQSKKELEIEEALRSEKIVHKDQLMQTIRIEHEGLHALAQLEEFDEKVRRERLSCISEEIKHFFKEYGLDEELKKEFEFLLRSVEQQIERFSKLKQIEQQRIDFNAAIEKIADFKALKKLNEQFRLYKRQVQDLDWPIFLKAPKELKIVQQSIDTLNHLILSLSANEKKAAEIAKKSMEYIEGEFKEGHYHKCEEEMKKMREHLNWLESGKYKNLYQRYHHLIDEMKSMKDWVTFAILPKKEELCIQMAQLSDANMLPDEKWDLLRKLQEDWKALGQLNLLQDRELNTKFRALQQKVFLQVEPFLTEKAQLREQNYVQKQQLCEDLKNYVQHLDWEKADWHKVMETLKLSKRTWVSLSYGDAAKNKQVQKVFDGLVKEIESKIQNEKMKNLEKKKQLVSKACHLKEQENVKEALFSFENLKKEWKEIGISFKDQSDELWLQLQEVHQFLQQRKLETTKEFQARLESNQKQIESHITKIAEILEKEKDLLLFKSLLDEMKKEVAGLTPLPKAVAEELKKRFYDQAHAFDRRLKAIDKRKYIDSYHHLVQKTILCELLEHQWGPHQEASDLIKKVKMSWLEIGDVPSDFEVDINSRFDHALSLLKKNEAITSLESLEEAAALQEKTNAAQKLAVRMEILAGMESSSMVDHQMKLSLQVERLSGHMGVKKKTFEEEWVELVIARVSIRPFRPDFQVYFDQFGRALEQALAKQVAI